MIDLTTLSDRELWDLRKAAAAESARRKGVALMAHNEAVAVIGEFPALPSKDGE